MRNNFKKFITAAMVLILLLGSVSNPLVANADSKSELAIDNITNEKVKALGSSVYFTNNGLIDIDREEARTYYDFNEQELDSIQEQLNVISEERVAGLKTITMNSQSDGDVQTKAIPVIVWVGAGVIGVLTGAAIYFTAKYMNWQEKKYLVDRCYDEGGRPILDTEDTAGIGAAPKKAWWKIGNTYKFECAAK